MPFRSLASGPSASRSLRAASLRARRPSRLARPVRDRDRGAALAAIAAAPWDADPTGWGTLCTAQAPCDTLWWSHA